MVFALDITDPERLGPASVLWELGAADQPELGHLRFPIETGQLPNREWVALFGNGSGGQSGEASLFVVNLASQRVDRLPVQAGLRGNGLGGVGLLKDANGQVTAAYAGDLRGNVYRFDYAPAARATGFFQLGKHFAHRALCDALTEMPALRRVLELPMLDWAITRMLSTHASGRLSTMCLNIFSADAICGSKSFF